MKRKINPEPLVIAVDFDGVIGDTAKDSCLQSVRAWNSLGGNIKFNRELERKYRQGRNFSNSHRQYYTILRLITENPNIDFSRFTQFGFNEEVKKDSLKTMEKFGKEFERQRALAQKRSMAEWYRNQRAMPGSRQWLFQMAKEMGGWEYIFIATTKGREATLLLLKQFGIPLKEENVIANNFSHVKTEQLKEIARRTRVDIGRVRLVDDSITQLKEAREIGAQVVLAQWGYLHGDHIKEAREIQIPRVGLRNKVRKKDAITVVRERLGKRRRMA